MADRAGIASESAKTLTGHLADYGELLGLLAERPGLVVVAGDPLSGTSALLEEVRSALEVEGGGTYLRTDARSCQDTLYLAMAIADLVVGALAPEAEAWWMGEAAPASTAGLRLSRALSVQGTDLRELKQGSGRAGRRLADAFDLLATLASDGDATLIVDHLGLLLAALPEDERRELLAELRAARQRHPGLNLVLVEYTDGHIARALRDSDHPLFHAGQVIGVRRPRPERFAGDLAVSRAWTDVPVEDLTIAAELAAGVPSLTWQILELRGTGEPPLEGWRRLRAITEESTARQWDLLRRVHRQAQPVVAAMSVGLRPHSIAANPKSVNDALTRLQDLGQVWQPEERTWSIASPLLRAWAREHPPSWARHRVSRA